MSIENGVDYGKLKEFIDCVKNGKTVPSDVLVYTVNYLESILKFAQDLACELILAGGVAVFGGGEVVFFFEDAHELAWGVVTGL